MKLKRLLRELVEPLDFLGVFQKIAKSIKLLELFGLQGIKNLSEYLNDENLKKFKNLKQIVKNNKSEKDIFCPINLGVNFLDQVRTLEKFKKCTFEKVGYPLLFLPFLSRASEVVGKKILFKFNDNQFLLNFNMSVFSTKIDDEYPAVSKNIEISFRENKDNFSETEWKNLYKLSEETFVEETDSLKQSAAGAGLTDND